ncbi:MAG: hypothetical protein J6B75_05795 [Ruminococcus sp.]|nr:hypothetical protein [Ruminococcus sp.]
MIKNTNIPAIEQAVQVIFDMSADTALRERTRLREKTLHDEASALLYKCVILKVTKISEYRKAAVFRDYFLEKVDVFTMLQSS